MAASSQHQRPPNPDFTEWGNDVDQLIQVINETATFKNDSKYHDWATTMRPKVRDLQSRGAVFATYESTQRKALEVLRNLDGAEASMTTKRADPVTAYEEYIQDQGGASQVSKSKEASNHGDGSLSLTGSLVTSSSPTTVIL
jgi:hypothetical protein